MLECKCKQVTKVGVVHITCVDVALLVCLISLATEVHMVADLWVITMGESANAYEDASEMTINFARTVSCDTFICKTVFRCLGPKEAIWRMALHGNCSRFFFWCGPWVP